MKTIKIRGHHIESLAEFIFDGETIIPELVSESFPNTNPKSKDPKERVYSISRALIKKHTLNSIDQKIVEDPSIVLEIVFGPDDYCNACPNKEGCSNLSSPTNDAQDRRALQGFGLYKTKYSSEELISMLKRFSNKTGYASPRRRGIKMMYSTGLAPKSSALIPRPGDKK